MAGSDLSPTVQESPCPCTYRLKSPSPEGGLTSEYGVVILDLIFRAVLLINSGS